MADPPPDVAASSGIASQELDPECPPSRAPSGCPPDARPWVLVASILGSAMAFVDGSVLQIALPKIQSDFNASLAMMQWVHNGYLLMLSALLLAGGSAGDLFGRRRIFHIGIVLFTLASVWCGFAGDAFELALARVFQGLGGALLVPNSLALVSAHFPATERGRAIGAWAAFGAITTAAGPPLGGWLMDVLSWRYVFFLNVPVATAALLVSWLRVPETGRLKSRKGLDVPGALLAAGLLASLTYALIESSERGWQSPRVLAMLCLAPVLLALYIWRQKRARDPMTPLEAFRNRTFTGANALTLALYFSLSGVFFLTGFYLIQVHEYSGTEAGLAALPFPALLFALSRFSGRIADRFGPRPQLILGPLVAAAGCVLFAMIGLDDDYWTGFLPAYIVMGLGMAATVAPLTTTVMSSLDAEHTGVASGLNNTVSRIAGLLAVAILGALAVSVFDFSLREKLEAGPLVLADFPPGVLEKMAGVEFPEDLPAERVAEMRSLVREAFAASYRSVMYVCAASACLGAFLAWFWIRPEKMQAGDASSGRSPGET